MINQYLILILFSLIICFKYSHLAVQRKNTEKWYNQEKDNLRSATTLKAKGGAERKRKRERKRKKTKKGKKE